MTSSNKVYSERSRPQALLPWLASIAAHQWRAFKAARRAVRAEELTQGVVLQDAQALAQLARAMSQKAIRR